MKIAPSVLAADFSNLECELKDIETGGADLVHLDVMDGTFVPNISFGPPVIQSLRKVTLLPFDVHLMTYHPEYYFDSLGKIGVDMISFHQEAVIHVDRTIHDIKSRGIKAGIALNPGTSLSALELVLPLLDFVLIMSVNPGFGGQRFISYTLDKIKVLKNCTNLEIFRPLSFEEKNKYRAKYGIGQDEFAILFAGRISREKGVMQLLNVVANLNKKYSNIKTIIVGSSKSGTNNIDSYTSDVIAKIKKLGDKVKFTGYIKYKELGNVYNVADVAVFPAIWEEPAGLTIIEAMACKIPVVTTYSGGIVEYTDKNSSILCNKDERLEKELEENIIKIIENKKLSNKIAENGYKKAKEYNLQKYYEEFCKIIDRNSES